MTLRNTSYPSDLYKTAFLLYLIFIQFSRSSVFREYFNKKLEPYESQKKIFILNDSKVKTIVQGLNPSQAFINIVCT